MTAFKKRKCCDFGFQGFRVCLRASRCDWLIQDLNGNSSVQPCARVCVRVRVCLQVPCAVEAGVTGTWNTWFQTSDSQECSLWTSPISSPGNWLEMQIRGLRPRQTASGTLGLGPGNQRFHKPAK